jgi:predicted dehydrogenase
MTLTPVVIGRGMAGQAMRRSLAIVGLMHPELEIQPALDAERGRPLDAIGRESEHRVLLVANPHALHAAAIVEGARAGFKAIIAEKPACVSSEQMVKLDGIAIPVSICHGYRVMWGPRTIRHMIAANELGRIIAVDGRCWQSSAAQRALDPTQPFQLWKNDPTLSGPSDVLIDNGSHWVDLATYLMGEPARKGTGWVSYVNAEAPHRDTHAHLDLLFSEGRQARASISKTVHGAGNDLEFTVIGSRRSATWAFLRPDIIEVGDGGTRTTLHRKDFSMGSGSRPFHGVGWLEGYVEIIRQTLLGLIGKSTVAVPTLAEGLQVMKTIFSLERSRIEA